MTKRLPAILQEIADVIGYDAMLCVVRARGGTRTYIPASLAEGHWLVETIGPFAASKMAKHFAQSHYVHGRDGVDRMSKRGVSIELPLFQKPLIDAGGNASSSEAARKLGVTQRTIHRRRARLNKLNRNEDGSHA